MPTYIDIDLSFTRHPGTGDLFKKFDVDAVKFALKNLILSNTFDKPFKPNFALNIRNMLFELPGAGTDSLLKKQIMNLIAEYEPRINLQDVTVDTSVAHTLSVSIIFQVIGNYKTQTLTVAIERVR